MANLFKNFVILNIQQARHLPRWGSRRPAGVIMPEEYDPKTDSVVPNREFVNQQKLNHKVEESRPQPYPKIKWKQPSRDKIAKEFDISTKQYNSMQEKNVKPLSIAQKIKKQATKSKALDVQEATLDAQGHIVYTKMQNNDIRISKLMADLKSKNLKDQDLMLLEGKILIKEALAAKCKLEYILFSRMKEVEYLTPYLPKKGAKLYKMPYRELQTWSGLVTNPGVMGIFKIPNTESFETAQALPLTIICDNVREPSNLGAILRTSSGVGCEKVILTKGCVNVWESKVLRSACGAHFKLHISKKPSWEEIRTLLPEHAIVFIADNNTVTSQDSRNDSLGNLVSSIPVLPYFSVNFKSAKHIVLIIGGETEGISEECYKLAKDFNGLRLNVPLSNGLDSLNTGTALGIIAFEVKRQSMALKSENLEDYKVRNMSLNT